MKPALTTVTLGCLLLLLPCPELLAAPPADPVFDGRLIEYDATDLRDTFVGAPAWPGNTMSNLYITWDATNLYLGLECRMDNNKVSILLDVDPGNGTGATTTTNWLESDNVMFIYNDNGWQASDAPGATPFGLDFYVATEGFYNSVVGVQYDGVQIPGTHNGQRLFDLPDLGNGAIPLGTAVEMVVLKDSSPDPHQGFETRIPWSTIYGTYGNRFGPLGPGATVPTGATIRLFANIHNNSSSSSFSAPDTIPQQVGPNADYADGFLTTDTYLDVVIDQDNDGLPDLAATDVNAPYLAKLIGVTGSPTLTGVFNEAVTEITVTETLNWSVTGFDVLQVNQPAPNRVVVTLDASLPVAGTWIPVQTLGIEDSVGNSRVTHNAFPVRSQAYLSRHGSMAVAGDFQAWNPAEQNMTLIADSTWQHDRSLAAPSGIAFKFAANGTWTTNFGRSSLFSSSTPLLDAAPNAGGQNIVITNPVIGVHRFLFNEQSGAFSLVKVGADSDGDGMPDEWETIHGFDPTDNGSGAASNGSNGNADLDPADNGSEYISDTDPNDPYSFFALHDVVPHPSGGFDITFHSSSNRLYTLEVTPIATNETWIPVPPGSTAGSGQDLTLTEAGTATSSMYRVRVHVP